MLIFRSWGNSGFWNLVPFIHSLCAIIKIHTNLGSVFQRLKILLHFPWFVFLLYGAMHVVMLFEVFVWVGDLQSVHSFPIQRFFCTTRTSSVQKSIYALLGVVLILKVFIIRLPGNRYVRTRVNKKNYLTFFVSCFAYFKI